MKQYLEQGLYFFLFASFLAVGCEQGAKNITQQPYFLKVSSVPGSKAKFVFYRNIWLDFNRENKKIRLQGDGWSKETTCNDGKFQMNIMLPKEDRTIQLDGKCDSQSFSGSASYEFKGKKVEHRYRFSLLAIKKDMCITNLEKHLPKDYWKTVSPSKKMTSLAKKAFQGCGLGEDIQTMFESFSGYDGGLVVSTHAKKAANIRIPRHFSFACPKLSSDGVQKIVQSGNRELFHKYCDPKKTLLKKNEDMGGLGQSFLLAASLRYYLQLRGLAPTKATRFLRWLMKTPSKGKTLIDRPSSLPGIPAKALSYSIKRVVSWAKVKTRHFPAIVTMQLGLRKLSLHGKAIADTSSIAEMANDKSPIVEALKQAIEKHKRLGAKKIPTTVRLEADERSTFSHVKRLKKAVVAAGLTDIELVLRPANKDFVGSYLSFRLPFCKAKQESINKSYRLLIQGKVMKCQAHGAKEDITKLPGTSIATLHKKSLQQLCKLESKNGKSTLHLTFGDKLTLRTMLKSFAETNKSKLFKDVCFDF